MAWNRSTDQKAAAPAKKPGVKHGLIAGIVIVALGGTAAWLLLPSGEKPVEKHRDPTAPSRIKEVTPAAAPKAEVAEEAPKGPEKKKPWWETENTNGFTAVQQQVWKLRRQKPAYVARRANRKRADFAIFEHRSENLIASYLALEPGQGIIGSPNLNGIEEDFMESLKTPIIPTADDSPEIAAWKRTMNQTKIDIKARLDAGEKLTDILAETHREAQRLAQLKQMITTEVHNQINENSTKQDVEDFVAAANKMLEEKGIAPISAGPIIKHKLMLDYADEDEGKGNGEQGAEKKEE